MTSDEAGLTEPALSPTALSQMREGKRIVYLPAQPAAVILSLVISFGLLLGYGTESISSPYEAQPRPTAPHVSATVQKPSHDALLETKADFPELVASIHQQVNEFRRTHGRRPLTLHPLISAEAKKHSIDMARTGDVSLSGFDERLNEIRKTIPFRAAAENIAASIGDKNPAREAVEGWKKSPRHRKNMLGDFSLTGIGVAPSEQGRYFFTQIFLQP